MKYLQLLALTLFLPLYVQGKASVNKLAPDFSLKDENNQLRSLSSFYGKKVALFFYPKNDSYYCTKEVCSLRDGTALLSKNNIVLIGVSYAQPKENKQFKDKYSLPFLLLSDHNKKISKLYGTDSWWTLGFFPKRKTFLINEQGIIVSVLDNVDVEKHAQQIVDHFKKT